VTDPLFDAENEARALVAAAARVPQLEAELEAAKELAMEAVEARDIGRAALRLMESQLSSLRSRCEAAEAEVQAFRFYSDEFCQGDETAEQAAHAMFDKVVEWRVKAQAAERSRDEARAEVEALKATVDELTPCDCGSVHNLDEDGCCRTCGCDLNVPLSWWQDGYAQGRSEGAEWMREQAAKALPCEISARCRCPSMAAAPCESCAAYHRIMVAVPMPVASPEVKPTGEGESRRCKCGRWELGGFIRGCKACGDNLDRAPSTKEGAPRPSCLACNDTGVRMYGGGPCANGCAPRPAEEPDADALVAPLFPDLPRRGKIERPAEEACPERLSAEDRAKIASMKCSAKGCGWHLAAGEPCPDGHGPRGSGRKGDK
jgi:hypothetical protein